MMDLEPETIELLQICITSLAVTFVGMLLVHAVSHLLEKLFKG
jgi:hypothetical protein